MKLFTITYNNSGDSMKKHIIIILCIFLYICLLRYAFSLLCPFLLALCCFFLFEPLMNHIQDKLSIHQWMSHSIVLLLLYCMILMLIIAGGILLYYLLMFLIYDMPLFVNEYILPLLESLYSLIEKHIPQISQVFSFDFILSMIETILSFIFSYIQRIPQFLFSFMLFLIATFFLFYDYQSIHDSFILQMNHQIQRYLYVLKNEFMNSIIVYFKCQLIMMGISFVVLYIIYSILRIDYAFSFALLTSLLDSLPIIGVGIVMIPMCLYYCLIGNYLMCLYLFCVYLLMNVLRSILEPYLLKKQMKIPSFILLLSLVIHVHLFGLIGVILSPIHMSILYSYMMKESSQQ